VAFWLRAIFEHFGLQSFPKTSGSKGMQIYVPLNSKTSYDETKPFAHALARLLENEHRDLVVSDMKKAIRTNKVFVDWSQNDEHKTTVSVYSLRARERPTVSTPITWEEVERALKKKDPKLLVFESHQTLERVEKLGDLFAPLLKMKQRLPKLPGLEEGKAEAIASGLDMAAQADGSGRRKTAKAASRSASRRSRQKV
jgi:bifunctional non-homologous end joining protein LigD